MGTLLLYDADCGFCTRAIGLAPRLRLGIEIGTIQGAHLDQLGIDPDRAMREIPAVIDDQVVYGHQAIAAALRTGPTPVKALGVIAGARSLTWLLRPAYRWIADHRHSLPGGTPACELPQR